MLQKLVILIYVLMLFSCNQNEQVAEEQKEKLSAEVSIGDDIYSAKVKLEAAGFTIKYGPEYPTKTKKYLMMIVDYGLTPTAWDTFQYTVEKDLSYGDNKSISCIIKSTPEGEITSID